MIYDDELGERFEEEFGSVLDDARVYEQRCLNAQRWFGNAILIVVDAALDSTGLGYFSVVSPRVSVFNEEYVEKEIVKSLADLSKLSPDDRNLRAIMNNGRVWNVAIKVAGIIEKIRQEENIESDIEALRYWAKSASYEGWKEDAIGRINGVGLITFQYLRMQAGVDTSMPDKIIKRAINDLFGIATSDDIQFISAMEYLSEHIGHSQILICWAIWLKMSDVK
ncbi:MAG: hypothetical protein SVY15_04845 [Halobacteriota archaeon]|nr:hypothetical protein [Halobacteriota archaeon]